MTSNNNERNSESIFNSSAHQEVPIISKEVPMPTTAGSTNFIEGLLSKLIKNPKDLLFSNKKGNVTNIIEQNIDFFEALVKLKFRLVMQDDGFIIVNPDNTMSGKVTFLKNNESKFDDNAQILFNQIANLIINNDGLETMIDAYEKDNFYPVGELVKETITYNGKEIEVMAGTLMNPKKETKKVYFYKGKEVFPDQK
ncbi:MAG: hypothetical protein K6E29_06400 [Cyanobacteria bacterium RUI128]|nr:hypothetical protein [Cyanobacteria bacterium RUI128]